MLKQELMKDLKQAMKDGNVVTKNAIQMIRAVVSQTEIDKKVELDDNGIMEIIFKQIKQKEDALEQFEKAGREDLISQTRDEINICKMYLPEMASDGEVIIKAEMIKEEKCYGQKDMGKLIKDLKDFYGLKATGKMIANAAKIALVKQ